MKPIFLARSFRSIGLVAAAITLLVGVGALILITRNTTASSTRRMQTVDGLTLVLETPAQPKILESQQLLVTLTDAQGRPVDEAQVYLDLTMPAMPMGLNQPIATPLGNGKYRVETAYTMAGTWAVTVVAKVNNKEHRAVFDVQVN